MRRSGQNVAFDGELAISKGQFSAVVVASEGELRIVVSHLRAAIRHYLQLRKSWRDDIGSRRPELFSARPVHIEVRSGRVLSLDFRRPGIRRLRIRSLKRLCRALLAHKHERLHADFERPN